MREPLSDKEFGEIQVISSIRARHIIFRWKEGRLQVSVPKGATQKMVMESLESLRERIRRLRQRSAPAAPLITPDFRLEVEGFRLEFRETTMPRLQAQLKDSFLSIIYPKGTDFQDEELQKWFRKVMERALVLFAEKVLPPRLESLARKHGLRYDRVRISRAHTSWGTCSRARVISLSCYLLLLPGHLQELVMLHELSHTVYMSHSHEFHQLLNSLVNGQEEELNKELKGHHTTLFG